MVQQMSEMAVRMNNAASQMETSWLRQIRVALDRIWQESLKILLMPSGRNRKSHGIIGKGRNRSAD